MVDDGNYELSEYERLRQERIRKNEAYLASLGLGNKGPKVATATTHQQGRKVSSSRIKKPITKGIERRSKRIETKKSSKEALIMLSYAEPDDRTLRVVPQSSPLDDVGIPMGKEDMERPIRRFRPISLSLNTTTTHSTIASRTLTDAEKQVLSSIDQNYLDKFREFLVFHDKISPQNERNVMRQVTKLAQGDGIRYESPKYGWPEDCYFLKGDKVTPLSDFVDLLQQAVEAENKWGQDRGNGWLLRHPLKKLLLFQQFCLRHPDFLMAKCKLQDYYEQQPAEEV